jgi:peptidoglycan/LPS O-acetylase OafA/YrhL
VFFLLTGAVVVLLAAAWLVHRLIKRPLAPLLRRWCSDRASAAASTASPGLP